MDNPITVLFPTGSDKNPYHRELFVSLQEQNVSPISESLPLFFPLIRAAVRRDETDVIHLDWLYPLFMVTDYTRSRPVNTVITITRAIFLLLDLLVVRSLGVPLVWTVHNRYHHERYYQRLERLLNVAVANIVNSLTVKCDSAKRTISDLYHVRDESKIQVIPDGNYIDAYPNTVQREAAREWLGIGDEFVYLYFGLIRPYKGVGDLIDRFAAIDPDESTLWVVGSPKTPAIEQRLQEKAVSIPHVHTEFEYVPQDEVQYYMNAADVLVLPYDHILNSGSVYLGLSFGKPIVTPRLGCIPSVVPPVNDLLYDPGDPNGLENALKQASERDLGAIETANLRRVNECKWSNSAAKYRKLYESL